MRTGLVSIPSAWDLDWNPLDTSRDGNVPGPVWKLLSVNEDTKASTYVIHFPPNWRDDELDWHPGAEENFILSGRVIVGKKEWGDAYQELDDETYTHRPPGILHGPAVVPDLGGCTILHRLSGDLRILRYHGDQFPHRHMQPITDDLANWPIPYEEAHPTKPLPWEESTGGWAGTRHKWVWRYPHTGGGVVMIDLPAGWEGTGSAAVGSVEEFVLDGAYEAGGVEYGLWGYTHRPPGHPAGTYRSESGARILCYWDEANEFTGEATGEPAAGTPKAA